MTQPPNIDQIRQAAEAGDERAQYMLAAALSGAGQRDEAERWLNAAANNGEPDALYTLATRKLQTYAGAEDAVDLLQRASGGGSLVAKRLLGVLLADGLGVEQDWRDAIDIVVDAAAHNDAAAQREIGMLLLASDVENSTGALLIERAAASDAVAAAICIRRFSEGRVNAPVDAAESALRKLEAMRYPRAEMLADSMYTRSRSMPATKESLGGRPNFDWKKISAQLEVYLSNIAGKHLQSAETISETPDVSVFRKAFSPEECEYVMASAARFLAPSMTVDPRTGATRQDAYRTSLTATLGPVDLDFVLVALNRRLAGIADASHKTGEFLSVLHYSKGQEYRPHFDWLPSGEDFDRGGQRVKTVLTYLNDEYQGGETHFLTPDIQFRGEVGDVLLFHNVTSENGPDKTSRHASLPVTQGVKWLASKWFRENNYKY